MTGCGWRSYIATGVRHFGLDVRAAGTGVAVAVMPGGILPLAVGVAAHSAVMGIIILAGLMALCAGLFLAGEAVWHQMVTDRVAVGWAGQGWCIPHGAVGAQNWPGLQSRAWSAPRPARRQVRALAREAAVLWVQACDCGTELHPEVTGRLAELHGQAEAIVVAAERLRRSKLDSPRAAARALAARLEKEDTRRRRDADAAALVARLEAQRELPSPPGPDFAGEMTALAEGHREVRQLASPTQRPPEKQ